MASFTVATKTSPIEAYRRLEPPSTLMQRTSLAPLLSATRRRDSCWIIGPARALRRGASACAWRAAGSRGCAPGRPPGRRWWWRRSSRPLGGSGLGRGDLPLAQEGVDAGDLLAEVPQAGAVLQAA